MIFLNFIIIILTLVLAGYIPTMVRKLDWAFVSAIVIFCCLVTYLMWVFFTQTIPWIYTPDLGARL